MVNDIPAGDGNIEKLFLRGNCSMLTLSDQRIPCGIKGSLSRDCRLQVFVPGAPEYTIGAFKFFA